MMYYALVFFVIALIAALLGFRGVAGLSAEIGWFFGVIAVILLIIAILSGRPTPSGVHSSYFQQSERPDIRAVSERPDLLAVIERL